ncbi:lactate utilization protein B/C [Flaviaesturariibacter flavus]|uniref:Lactate utilization protein B/C n=1 Tax=Flaviaesturariibacter flavus TaxID=2502780 RepID=A0A4R1BPN0_9BACT|nr:LUD domain-containing protein [Flaviaesturariibacter flavus]TCJ19589.1 lactate utilization protein B/C [Flaviaesturariibacter flavus]
MSSRESILSRIRANRPPGTALPESIQGGASGPALLSPFSAVLTGIGGQVLTAGSLSAVQEDLDAAFRQGRKVINGIRSLQGANGNAYAQMSGSDMEAVEVLYLEGALGVAENGAVWLSEGALVHRLLPFACRELVLALRAESIVADMHEAYRRIRIDAEGYGLFIAGPSKTADIEQSLVIGAHGPLALRVWVIDETLK